MSKTILRKVPDEDMYYNFEDEVEIDTSKVVICGNRNYREFGDETLIDIIEGNYYDEETEKLVMEGDAAGSSLKITFVKE